MNKIRIILLILTTLVFMQSANANAVGNLRNQRYCEILLKTGKMSLSVYNSIGLNNCPENLWRRLNINAIKKQKKVSVALLNGPRYWVIDEMRNSQLINPNIENFDGIQMREAGIVRLSLWDIMHSKNEPYKQRTVERKTTWVYLAQRPVYELISPDGQVYVMQSYSVEKTTQTIQSLAQLGSRLKLPAGWRFCTGILPKTGYLISIEKAIVVQDNLLNTYQLQTDPNFINLIHC